MISGTIGFIFSALEQGATLSQAVREAFDKGYTEPDPRIDLSGIDVARKLLILARRSGVRAELTDVEVEPLLPEKIMRSTSVKQFFSRLSEVDRDYAKKIKLASGKGKVLRYVGTVEGSDYIRVKLQAVDVKTPLGRLNGGDNLVIFTTQRYRENPLIVQGPGAGPDVTAGGVFADILKVAHLLTG